MFYFRINKLRIFDNHENAFLFFKRDLAQVQLISFITADAEVPLLDAWIAETDKIKKKNLLIQAVQQVASARILTKIANVKDNAVLTFGDTGYVLYQSTAIPEDFNWCLIATEGDDNIRLIGEQLDAVVNHPEFDAFASNLGTLLLGAANPTFAAGVIITKFLTNMAADILKKNTDDQLGILYMSLNRKEHYLYGERKRDGIPDLTGNMRIDYSIFAFK
ncbi:hypothetical protein Z042_16425 [Chania multitudinisentens RB-25]|uniref:Uncharacterized protein n=1 Tax=Chania multitudinisentens RB-25 TaxID=1441930 RepID=W0LGM3_9GAMM|nr:hypothetical protein [Chania multitudinisentens]AHG22871.1 hypothetical protein Z042_16425 [Chania multitudinisentens RB-25]